MTGNEAKILLSMLPPQTPIHAGLLEDKTDRVLIEGIASDGLSFVVSLKNGEILLSIGGCNVRQNEYQPEELIPNEYINIYKSDFEFCKLLAKSGKLLFDGISAVNAHWLATQDF